MNLQNRKRLTDLKNKFMVAWGEERGKWIVRDFGVDMYTLLYLKRITSKDPRHNTWNSAQCFVVAWMGGEFGREWIHVYVWLSPFAVHIKLSQYC